jgi:hypothetical protein
VRPRIQIPVSPEIKEIPISFFTEMEKSILKFIWKHKRPQISKAILNKKRNAGGITIAAKTTWHWGKKQKKNKM